MCGRMTPLTYDEVLDVLRSVRGGEVANPWPDWPAVAPRRDAFPQSWVPLAVPSPTAPTTLEVRELNWGYPVSWKQGVVFNTRIESMLQEQGMWRESAERRRCLVPAVRFYETHRSETTRNPTTGRRVKQAYGFQLADEPVLWMAGIYEDDHFSIVTTRPNDTVAPVHDRMPLVLRQGELPLWLGDGYAQLADRSGVTLISQAEMPGSANPDKHEEQLSLF